MYEGPLKAGPFGLVVGSTALTVTWPGVVAWMRGEIPPTAIDARAIDADGDADADESTVELARGLFEKTARVAADRLEELGEDLGAYIDNARWQLPRLTKLRPLQDRSLAAPGP